MSAEELDRNSRLPGTPKRPSQTTEEDSLLSGDESDDEDLSESVDWVRRVACAAWPDSGEPAPRRPRRRGSARRRPCPLKPVAIAPILPESTIARRCPRGSRPAPR